MPIKEAEWQMTHTIAWAAAHHTRWFWGGVYGPLGEQQIGDGQNHHH
jgi:hypothetical protein